MVVKKVDQFTEDDNFFSDGQQVIDIQSKKSDISSEEHKSGF